MPVAVAEAAFRGLVMVLQRDHQSLHRPQRSERDDEDQRQPQHGVNPVGRLIEYLGHQRGADHDGAGEKHDEHGRSVAGVGEAVI